MAKIAPNRGWSEIANEILSALRLRHRRLSEPFEVDDLDLGEAGAREAARYLPVDVALYAIRLAASLSPYFQALDDVRRCGRLVKIHCLSGDDLSTLGEVICDALGTKDCLVARNPNRGRPTLSTHKVAVFEHEGIAMSVFAEAARSGLTIVALSKEGADASPYLDGADIRITLAPFETSMLHTLLTVSLGEAPTQTLHVPARAFEASQLVAHIRRGRPVEDCLNGLLYASGTGADASSKSADVTDDFHKLQTYGKAQEWALELASDFRLWRQGELTWEGIGRPNALLAGPPGTGKTSFAALLAKTLGVPFSATSVAEWNSNTYLSGTLKAMRKAFDDAIERAPTVLLIDEMDGISSRVSAHGSQSGEYWSQIVNLFLELLTRIRGAEGVVVVGATNFVNRIDPAILRSGRLDNIVEFDLPDQAAISSILRFYLADDLPAADLSYFARRLRGTSGADVEKVVRLGRAKARRARRPLAEKDLLDHIPDPFGNVLPDTRRRIAVYQRGQALVAGLVGLSSTPINADLPLSEVLKEYWSVGRYPVVAEIESLMVALLAGRAAEVAIFGDVSTIGAGTTDSDLALANRLAEMLECRMGAGGSGLLFLDATEQVGEKTGREGVRARLDRAFESAQRMIEPLLNELVVQPVSSRPNGSVH